MVEPKRIALGLVCWGIVSLTAVAQNVVPSETELLRTEVAELKQLVGQLTRRIQTLEAQAAQNRPTPALRSVGFDEPVRDNAEAAPQLLPRTAAVEVPYYSYCTWWRAEPTPTPLQPFRGLGSEEGMQIDAQEHAQRWERALQAVDCLELP